MDTLQQSISNISLLYLIIFVLLVISLTFLISYLQGYLLQRLLKYLKKKTPSYWDDVLIDALISPLYAFIWLIGICLAVQIISYANDNIATSTISTVRDLGIIIILAWFLIRLSQRIERALFLRGKDSKKTSLDLQAIDMIGKITNFSIFIIATIMILHALGYNISGVLAFGGIGGIAIGFAAKDLLANFFGGAIIYLDRPFSVGEWIRSPDREIEGVVEHIGWRLTLIRTFDKRPLYIPNSVFSNIAVENPGRMTNRRIYETIGIRYADAGKMEIIVNEVKQMLQTHEAIDPKQTLIVNFDKFSPSSLDFFIYTLTKTTDWVKFHAIKQDIMLRIIHIIESHNAECAFPTSTLHIPDTIRIEPVPEKT